MFTRSGSTWTQQGPKLTGSGETPDGWFGWSVALSSDGQTALIGGFRNNNFLGAAWVFTRSGSTWTQQGPKLTAMDAVAGSAFGWSVALSSDGNAALVGGSGDPNAGAAWVFMRSGSTWTQQGPKLTATGAGLGSDFGNSVGLSADGNIALIGDERVDAAWVFTTSGGTTTTPTGTTTTPTGTTTTSTGTATTPTGTATTTTTTGGGHGEGVTTFVRKPFVTHGNEVSFTVRCAHATCHDQAGETVSETLKGKQIMSISAAGHGHGSRAVKQTVAIASTMITIAAGATRKITLKLNKTGRNLLARFGKLPVHFTLTQRQAHGKLRTIKSVKLTVKQAPAKNHKR